MNDGQQKSSPSAASKKLGTEDPSDAATRIRQAVKNLPCICILGGTAFQGSDSEALVKVVAAAVSSRLKSRVAFLTGGMAGVQQTFAENCCPGASLWHLVPRGEASNMPVGQDIHAGEGLAERKDIFGCVGDVYITVEGGPGVAHEASLAANRGAGVIPLIRTGGASSGMFDFPSESLEKPEWSTAQQWAAIQGKDASLQEVGECLAGMIETLLDKIKVARPSTRQPTKIAEVKQKSDMLSKLLFKSVDATCHATLDRDHFAELLRRIDPEATKDKVNEIMASVDKDHDEHISLQEFTKWVSAASADNGRTQEKVCMLTGKNSNAIKQLFHILDKDHSGTLSKSELIQVVVRMAHISKEEAEHIFQAVDTDNSGLINYDEFADARCLDLEALLGILNQGK
eukprot:TRINITY_DN80999_c0_g1_i1.p1 TRINITY_DN80999_c0_g1~~TRINITY_DN80999_c0_g1_i1.p1  ORF type:complete len:467 (+),score=115.24 TRINITY_DN80999_c0_g1_i1:202-1401(+)